MLAWKIALRYLFSKKSHGAVNIISLISVIGVAVATMAITIVLSVFNGFTELSASHLSRLDPDLKVSGVSGKTIADADSLVRVISRIPGVAVAMPVIQERGLVIFGNMQMPVVFKGVPADYPRLAKLDSVLVEGEYVSEYKGMEVAQISAGIAVKTGARSGAINIISLYVPRRMGRINPANPSAAFNSADMMVSGIFQIGQPEYDADHMFIQIEQARELLQYDDEASHIEVGLVHGADEHTVAAELSSRLGSRFRVETRLQQQQESFRMIQIEKWVTFMMLAFILVIASFNIISTLSLLVIEKRSNMETLRALGAPASMIRSVFVIQGWLISVTGGIAGIVTGTLLSLAQERYGLIKLSGDTSRMTISTYPVEVHATDLVIVFALVVVVGFLTSQVTRLFTNDKISHRS